MLDALSLGQPLNQTQLGLLAIILIALGVIVADSRGLARDFMDRRAGGGRVLLALAGLTAIAAVLRVVAEPTFLRDAHLLPYPSWISDGLSGMHAIEPFPRGPEIMLRALAPLLSDDVYASWFAANIIIGTLTVPAAFALGTAVTGRRTLGFVVAATVTFLPQHIRVSASESTFVVFAFWVFIATALTVRAGRCARRRTLIAAMAATAATVIMRPEAALAVPALAIIGLGVGPGWRRHWRSPPVLVAAAVLLWLVVPSLVRIVTSETAADFMGGGSASSWPLNIVSTLVWPAGRNAFFDPLTSPLWIYPLAVWGGIVTWRAGEKAVAAGLAAMALTFLVLYSRIEPAAVIWKMARFHTAAIPAVAMLFTLGLDDALARLRPLSESTSRRFVAAVAVTGLGCVLWWPAVWALPLDRQRELHWAVDVGRAHPELLVGGTRLITPDNRRRFRDLSPREIIGPLGRGHVSIDRVVTVEQAIQDLEVGDSDGAAIFYEGLYCRQARRPGESDNPQCRAMHEVFDLRPIETITIDLGSYLAAYDGPRFAAPKKLTLYRIVGRRMTPAQGLRLLPAPVDADNDGDRR
ncbi:MAG: hypothetical protein V3T05_10420 [Myxococcota bacterium]